MKEMDLFKRKLNIEETKLNIVSDININTSFNDNKNGNFIKRNYAKNKLDDFITYQRNELKDYIINNPLFAKTLTPYNSNKSESTNLIPKIVNLMINSSNIANVGPTATIAGTIAELSLEYLMEQGSKYAIVENGGDIAFLNDYSDKKIICGIYAGKSPLTGKIGLEFKSKKKNCPLGVCSSSASVGYSISYGRSDCVTIIANQASVADGLATSIGNKVNGKLDSDAIENGLTTAEEFREHFIGALIIVKESFGTIGKLPKIVETNNEDVLNNFEEE